MTLPDWFGYVIGFGVVAAVFLVVFLVDRFRSKRMRRWAEARGWWFLDGRRPRGLHLGDLRTLPVGDFSYGCAGRVDDHVVHVFEHSYTVGAGKSRRRVVHAVCTIEAPRGPGLTIKREHAGHKILDALGGEDIDFESHEFSRRFWVQSPDRRFAYAVLHPRAMEFLLRHRRCMWEWKDGMLLVAVRKNLKPKVADRLVALAAGFRRLVPRHLEAAT